MAAAGAGGLAPVTVSPELRAQGRHALREAGWDGVSRIVVLHPGAGGAAKRWPVEGFLDVVAGIDATVVVHEGPADAEAARALVTRAAGAPGAEGARGHARFATAAGPRNQVIALVDPPLPVLAGVLAEAAAHLGNDSGISHLAAAVGTPSVVLFRPGALPWVPWSPTARPLTVNTTTVTAAERDAVLDALVACLGGGRA
jgi:ADP-heptose:LPS heptosyltransferase